MEAFGRSKQSGANIILNKMPRPNGDAQARDGSLQAEIEMLEILSGVGWISFAGDLGPCRPGRWPRARMQQHGCRIHPIRIEEGRHLVGTADRANPLIKKVLRKVGFRPGEVIAADGKVDARSKGDLPAARQQTNIGGRVPAWNCAIRGVSQRIISVGSHETVMGAFARSALMRRTSSSISPSPRATTCASRRPASVRKTARLRRSNSGVPRSSSSSLTARLTAPCVRFRRSAALLKLSSSAATRKQASAGSDVMCCLICDLFSHIPSEVIVFYAASTALLTGITERIRL